MYQGRFTSVSKAVSTAMYAVGGRECFSISGGRNCWYDHSVFATASL